MNTTQFVLKEQNIYFLIGVVECHQKKMRDSWLVYKIYYIVSFISDYICFQTNLQYIMQSGSNACRVLLLLFSCQKIVNDHNKFKKSIFSQKKVNWKSSRRKWVLCQKPIHTCFWQAHFSHNHHYYTSKFPFANLKM